MANELSNEDLRTELLARIERVETNLLKEFRKWALPVVSRIRTTEVTLSGISGRVELLEERVDGLEQGGSR